MIAYLLGSILFISFIFAPLYSIEIPLEGFGKTTSVAYVDMHKVFESFPETEKARIELNRAIEERKSEISEKKEEIAKLKVEVEFLRKQMSAVAPYTAPRNVRSEQPAAPVTPSPAASAPSSTQPVAPPAPEIPVESVSSVTAVSTPSAPASLTPLTLPPGSPLKFLFSPPKESTETAAPPVEVSTTPLVAISTSAPMILPGIPSPEPQLKDREELLTRRESELENFVGTAEQEIRQMEEGKTMTLMARIYKSLQEIAAKNGYSIVIDKEYILYGEPPIDITQNVIWRLTAPR